MSSPRMSPNYLGLLLLDTRVSNGRGQAHACNRAQSPTAKHQRASFVVDTGLQPSVGLRALELEEGAVFRDRITQIKSKLEMVN